MSNSSRKGGWKGTVKSIFQLYSASCEWGEVGQRDKEVHDGEGAHGGADETRGSDKCLRGSDCKGRMVWLARSISASGAWVLQSGVTSEDLWLLPADISCMHTSKRSQTFERIRPENLRNLCGFCVRAHIYLARLGLPKFMQYSRMKNMHLQNVRQMEEVLF